MLLFFKSLIPHPLNISSVVTLMLLWVEKIPQLLLRKMLLAVFGCYLYQLANCMCKCKKITAFTLVQLLRLNHQNQILYD